MAVSIHNLFTSLNIEYCGPVKWVTTVPADYNGVYIVARTDNPLLESAIPMDLELCESTFEYWKSKAPELEINKLKIKSKQELQAFLQGYWDTGENILYIGQASSLTNTLKKRVAQYYTHKVGHKGPHTGGYWLKLLRCLPETFVFYARSVKPHDTEFKLLMKFIELSQDKSFYDIADLGNKLPFANLKIDLLKENMLRKHTK